MMPFVQGSPLATTAPDQSMIPGGNPAAGGLALPFVPGGNIRESFVEFMFRTIDVT